MEWVVLGGVCVALIVFGFAKHSYYVVKNVWLIRYKLDEPVRALPAPGVVTMTGIVSTIGDEDCPVEVTLDERGRYSRGHTYWEQYGREVKARPFVLLLPETGARILVEPGDDVILRSSATLADWEFDKELQMWRRFRTGAIEDGDRVIVAGELVEKKEVEMVTSEYRSHKGKIRMEYVLRPVPGEPMRIDSETMLQEIGKRFGYVGWARALGTLVIPYFYVRALWDAFVDPSANIFWALVVGYGLIRFFFYSNKSDRRPWFDRPSHSKERYRGMEHGSSTPE